MTKIKAEKPVKGSKDKTSVITKMNDHQLFWVSLIARFNDELVEEQIITSSQRGEIRNYLQKKLESRRK